MYFAEEAWNLAQFVETENRRLTLKLMQDQLHINRKSIRQILFGN